MSAYSGRVPGGMRRRDEPGGGTGRRGCERDGGDMRQHMTNVAGAFAAGYAIVIGIASYWSIPSLPDAVRNDARDIAGILTATAYCGYKASNVHLLLDGDATLPRIRAALASVAEASGAEESVVVVFSGHGGIISSGAHRASALLPVECDASRARATCVSEAELSAALQHISARRVVVVIDACHAGGAASFKDPTGRESLPVGYSEKSLGRLAHGTGRVVIASSRADEASLVLGNARNSVFTATFLDALRGKAQTRGDGVIRVFDIFNYVSEMVQRTVPGRQHPVFKASGLEDNFPVIRDRGGIKAVSGDATLAVLAGDPRQLERVIADLYPAGPMDQEIWARAGGDPGAGCGEPAHADRHYLSWRRRGVVGAINLDTCDAVEHRIRQPRVPEVPASTHQRCHGSGKTIVVGAELLRTNE